LLFGKISSSAPPSEHPGKLAPDSPEAKGPSTGDGAFLWLLWEDSKIPRHNVQGWEFVFYIDNHLL